MDRQIEEAINNRRGLTAEVKDYIKNEIGHANKISEKKIEDLKVKQKQEIDNAVKPLHNKINNLVANPVPMGFIYVQLKDQPEPSKIWPEVGWTEVSSSYEGLFFRVIGGCAGNFGTIQYGASPRITRAHSESTNRNSYRNIYDIDMVPVGNWSSLLTSGKVEEPTMGIQFYTEKTEVRPTNTAMRIWKRTN